jgi:hypothetical protein
MKFVVRQGDCIASIAARVGLSAGELWNAEGNEALRRQRRDPYALLPNDVVDVPDALRRPMPVRAGDRNRYRAPRASEALRLRLLDADPYKNQPFTFTVAGIRSTGAVDGDGVATLEIPASAVEGELVIAPGENELRLRIDLGHLDPHDHPTGIQQRLNNLGFGCGLVDGDIGPRTVAALRAFQRSRQLPETGEADAETCAAIDDEHAR